MAQETDDQKNSIAQLEEALKQAKGTSSQGVYVRTCTSRHVCMAGAQGRGSKCDLFQN